MPGSARAAALGVELGRRIERRISRAQRREETLDALGVDRVRALEHDRSPRERSQVRRRIRARAVGAEVPGARGLQDRRGSRCVRSSIHEASVRSSADCVSASNGLARQSWPRPGRAARREGGSSRPAPRTRSGAGRASRLETPRTDPTTTIAPAAADHPPRHRKTAPPEHQRQRDRHDDRARRARPDCAAVT